MQSSAFYLNAISNIAQTLVFDQPYATTLKEDYVMNVVFEVACIVLPNPTNESDWYLAPDRNTFFS